MQLHDITATTVRRKHRQIGRGGKRGKTSGRGHKGQKARAGHSIRPAIRDEMKRLPKMRGRGISKQTSIQSKPVSINCDVVSAAFSAGEEVTPSTLYEKRVITKVRGMLPAVKILGRGTCDTKVTVRDCAVSAAARASIEAAGGSVAEA